MVEPKTIDPEVSACKHKGERNWFGSLLRCQECGEVLEDRHECWFDRDGFCRVCDKVGPPGDLRAMSAEHRPSEMRVYGWQGWKGATATREIVCARSKAAVARIAGVKSPSRLFNLTETGNAEELRVARAKPGVVFWRPLDSRGPYTEAK